MKRAVTRRSACQFGLLTLCALFGLGGLSGCAQAGATSDDAVAATFDGEAIYERDVTSEIRQARIAQNLENDEDWAKWLGANNYTAETIRQQAINSLVGDKIIALGAAEMNLEVDDAAVDEELARAKERYGSEEGFQAMLDTMEMSLEQYREDIRLALENQAIRETFADEEPLTDDELLAYAQTTLPSYNGARRSSHILFSINDEEKAKEVLEKLRAGEITFAEAAKEYSIDGSAEQGGDVGWDCLSEFVNEYTEPLDQLNKGDISDLVTTDYGIHIIQCTDVYEAPEEVSTIEGVPQEFLDAWTTDLQQQKEQEGFSNWYLSRQSSGNLVVHDMPSGLPYDIEPVKDESASSGEDAEGADAS